MTFDPEKPVQTRDGRKARIICTDTHHLTEEDVEFPITALVMSPHGQERPGTYQIDGTFYSGIDESGFDLINIPEKRWAVIWETEGECGATIVADERILQDLKQGLNVIACLPFTDGDGL